MTCFDSLGTSTTETIDITISALNTEQRETAIANQIKELENANIDEILSFISKLTSTEDAFNSSMIETMVSNYDRYFGDLVVFDKNTIDRALAALNLITQ